jgi:peptide-methionine (S)-S-oxide reductase
VRYLAVPQDIRGGSVKFTRISPKRRADRIGCLSFAPTQRCKDFNHSRVYFGKTQNKEVTMFRKIISTGLLLLAAMFAVNAANVNAVSSSNTETLTLGGGCFWCLEAVFTELKGVTSVESGYAGGHVANPSYEQVSSGSTGHAEVVQITFDPKVVDRSTVLRAFFTIHDPTTLNRQGADAGEQYRSVAFYRNEEQKAAIEKAIKETADSHEWSGTIVTQVVPFTQFYKAENYHQEYFKLHGSEPYCSLVIAPKVAKFRKIFHDQLK